jgi:hypothetical protein
LLRCLEIIPRRIRFRQLSQAVRGSDDIARVFRGDYKAAALANLKNRANRRYAAHETSATATRKITPGKQGQ